MTSSDEGKAPLAIGPPSHAYGRSISKNLEENYLSILRAVFVFIIMLCVLLEIYAWNAARIVDSWCLRVLAIISIFMIAVAFQGALGCYRSVHDLNLNNIVAISSTNSGQEVLLHSIYFCIPVFALYCLYGTAALFFTDEIVMYNKLTHQQEPRFSSEGFSIQDFEDGIELYISTAGYTTYLICFIVLITYHIFFSLTSEYEAIHTILQIHNAVLLGHAMLLLSSSLYALRFLLFFDLLTEGIHFAPIIAMGVVVLITVISFLGLYVGYSESKKVLIVYIMTMLIIGICVAIATVFIFILSFKFSDSINNICQTDLPKVSEAYLGKLGCSKYFRHIDGQYVCDDPVLITESAEPELGCINYSCCEALTTHATTTYNYMTILCGCIVLFCTLSLANAVFHYRKISKLERSYLHRYDGVIGGIMAGLLVAGLGVAGFVFFDLSDLT